MCLAFSLTAFPITVQSLGHASVQLTNHIVFFKLDLYHILMSEEQCLCPDAYETPGLLQGHNEVFMQKHVYSITAADFYEMHAHLGYMPIHFSNYIHEKTLTHP